MVSPSEILTKTDEVAFAAAGEAIRKLSSLVPVWLSTVRTPAAAAEPVAVSTAGASPATEVVDSMKNKRVLLRFPPVGSGAAATISTVTDYVVSRFKN